MARCLHVDVAVECSPGSLDGSEREPSASGQGGSEPESSMEGARDPVIPIPRLNLVSTDRVGTNAAREMALGGRRCAIAYGRHPRQWRRHAAVPVSASLAGQSG